MANEFGASILAREGVETTEFKSYDEVPWHKKRWFYILVVLFVLPVAIVMALTRDIYFSSNGSVLKYTKSKRLGLAAVWGALLVYNLVRAFG